MRACTALSLFIVAYFYLRYATEPSTPRLCPTRPYSVPNARYNALRSEYSLTSRSFTAPSCLSLHLFQKSFYISRMLRRSSSPTAYSSRAILQFSCRAIGNSGMHSSADA